MIVRSILILAALAVAPVASAQKPDIPRVTSLSIKGAVDHPKTLALADLQKEMPTTETISQKTGKGTLTGSYTGVLLWTLLQEAGIKVDSDGPRNNTIRHVVVITASDGYSAQLSTGELDPEFGGEPAIVAYAKDGQPLDDKAGFARLIIPGDKSAGRAIQGVASIEVR